MTGYKEAPARRRMRRILAADPAGGFKKRNLPPTGPVRSVLGDALVRTSERELGSFGQGRRKIAQQRDHRLPSLVVAGVEFHHVIVDGDFPSPQAKLSNPAPRVGDRREPGAVDHRETD